MNKKEGEGFTQRLKRSRFLSKLLVAVSILATAFMSIGFYFFIDYSYSVLFKNQDFNDESKIELKPFGKVDGGLLIRKAKIIEKGFDYKDSDMYLKAKVMLENYYKEKINKTIDEKIIAGSFNICRIDYDILNKSTSVPFCDDYVFKRNVELSLEKIAPFKSNLNISNKDIKKISFDYTN